MTNGLNKTDKTVGVDQFDTLVYRIVPLMFGEASLLTQPKAHPFGTSTSLGEIEVVPEIAVVVYR